MTTPDPKAPGELRPATSQLPRGPEAPNAPGVSSSTPGVALAGARMPGGPTLPDFDPVSLTNVMTQLANDLFGGSGAMPASQSPSGPGSVSALSPPSTPALPSESVPTAPAYPSGSPAGSPAAIPSGSPAAIPSGSPAALAPADPGVVASPFDAPLDFSAISSTPDPFGLSTMPTGLNMSLIDMPVAAPLQTTLPSAPVERPPTIIDVSTIQLAPADDPAIRSVGNAVFDPYALKREFPILREQVRGRPLVWLDNAATTQKPQTVIDRLSYFYEHENSNIHRAAHTLAARATDAYETARESVRRFINAPSVKDIIFVRGTTEGINLIAQSWGRRNLEPGDEIVITWLEHHANIVPWQRICDERGAKLRVAPVDDRGQVILEAYEKLFNSRTKLVSFTQVSNALGTITPAKQMIDIAHRNGALVVLDGAQAVSHMPVDVQALDCDFFVFSGHKVFGPTGIGAVYGKSELLDAMPPWQGGGNMISDVTFEKITYHPAPARFEAGTGNIADAVGLGAALDWLTRVGVARVEAYEHELLVYGTQLLCEVPGLTLIGTAAEKAGVLSFILAGHKTEEVGGLLDQDGIAVRSGHHCAQPILRRFGLEATVRASLAPYNTREDLDALAVALHRLQAGRASR